MFQNRGSTDMLHQFCKLKGMGSNPLCPNGEKIPVKCCGEARLIYICSHVVTVAKHIANVLVPMRIRVVAPIFEMGPTGFDR